MNAERVSSVNAKLAQISGLLHKDNMTKEDIGRAKFLLWGTQKEITQIFREEHASD